MLSGKDIRYTRLTQMGDVSVADVLLQNGDDVHFVAPPFHRAALPMHCALAVNDYGIYISFFRLPVCAGIGFLHFRQVVCWTVRIDFRSRGRAADHRVLSQMDSYAVGGIDAKSQVHYLYAPTHLNPTSDYGVSFERGTYVDYPDRRHVFVSGTASINNHGEIMYAGDIKKQALRMLENVEALLSEASCNFCEVSHMIVYLRDTADYTTVRNIFSTRFPDKPIVFVLAPVCRPGWLIEMECMAMKRL